MHRRRFSSPLNPILCHNTKLFGHPNSPRKHACLAGPRYDRGSPPTPPPGLPGPSHCFVTTFQHHSISLPARPPPDFHRVHLLLALPSVQPQPTPPMPREGDASPRCCYVLLLPPLLVASPAKYTAFSMTGNQSATTAAVRPAQSGPRGYLMSSPSATI